MTAIEPVAVIGNDRPICGATSTTPSPTLFPSNQTLAVPFVAQFCPDASCPRVLTALNPAESIVHTPLVVVDVTTDPVGEGIAGTKNQSTPLIVASNEIESAALIHCVKALELTNTPTLARPIVLADTIHRVEADVALVEPVIIVPKK